MSNDDNEIDLESVIGSIKKNFEDGFREGQGIIGGLGNDKKAEENTDSKASNEPGVNIEHDEQNIEASVEQPEDEHQSSDTIQDNKDKEIGEESSIAKQSIPIGKVAGNFSMLLGGVLLIAIGVYMVDQDTGGTLLTIGVILALLHGVVQCISNKSRRK